MGQKVSICSTNIRVSKRSSIDGFSTNNEDEIQPQSRKPMSKIQISLIKTLKTYTILLLDGRMKKTQTNMKDKNLT